MNERIATAAITRVTRDASPKNGQDALAIEEPLEIRVGDKPLSVTMRTPGDDFDLAAGFLFTESIVRDPNDIESIRHWGSPNVVRVALRDGVRIDFQKLQRHFYASSSCGVCGKTSIEALQTNATPIESDATIPSSVIHALPDKLRVAQKAFEETGAIHAAGLFDLHGNLMRIREDIGRHNAVDKLIGSYVCEAARPFGLLLLSGRAGFEVVQKAIIASIPIVAAVGAPSSLAVELARDFNLTLLGFVRDGRFNIYSAPQRIG